MKIFAFEVAPVLFARLSNPNAVTLRFVSDKLAASVRYSQLSFGKLPFTYGTVRFPPDKPIFRKK
jgi:hypothetical protein